MPLRVIQLTSNPHKSWDAAARSLVSAAGLTLSNIHSIRIKNCGPVVGKNKGIRYRVVGEITFEV
jgi:flavin-binding protein dodecin